MRRSLQPSSRSWVIGPLSPLGTSTVRVASRVKAPSAEEQLAAEIKKHHVAPEAVRAVEAVRAMSGDAEGERK